ncbi:MAG: phosphoglycerate kinase [Pirellulales bacterium]|nr:phosphoglycerate kinase [Pirellulales bacterium]
MTVSNDAMVRWCETLLGADGQPPRELEDYLAAIPRLAAIDKLPSGTRVLIRGDVDCKPGEQIGDGDIRLRSMVETLKFGRERGWVQIIFGHIGRKPEGTLAKVAARLAKLLEAPVELIGDWYDEAAMQISPACAARLKDAAPGSVWVLDNTRRYDVERVLWKAKPADLPGLAPKLAAFANQLAEKVAKYYVNEALSAGSLDASSTIVPAAMERSVLGAYVDREFNGPMLRCRRSQAVVFSGLKTDKLDDLEAMINRGTVQTVISAGSLAMALKKAAAKLDGQDFPLGVAEDPAHADKPYYIPPDRIEQAQRMIADGRKRGVKFVLPVDFVLADGTVSEQLGPGDQQFDIGPKTSAVFEQAVSDLIAQSKSQMAAGQPPLAVFHNGVFGMFEDPRFESGTRHFIGQLQRMREAGLEVYVGGGEGGTALEKYGQPDWVTHCFTAGGTVLNALGNQPVPYLQALALAAAGK